MDANYILAINPGNTSTKIAVYHSNKFVFLKENIATAKTENKKN